MLGSLVVLLMTTACASRTELPLRSAVSARTSLHLPTGTVVDTGVAEGRVYPQPGTYQAVGENEKGIFCASPVGVGIHVQLTAVDLFSVANGTLGTTVPVGVCVAKVPLGAESVVSYATRCVAPEAPAVPAAFSLAHPEVQFTVVL